jgi:hypothetical protein
VVWWRAEWLAPGGRSANGLAAALQEAVREYFADSSGQQRPEAQHQGFREAYRCLLNRSKHALETLGVISIDLRVGNGSRQ